MSRATAASAAESGAAVTRNVPLGATLNQHPIGERAIYRRSGDDAIDQGVDPGAGDRWNAGRGLGIVEEAAQIGLNHLTPRTVDQASDRALEEIVPCPRLRDSNPIGIRPVATAPSTAGVP